MITVLSAATRASTTAKANRTFMFENEMTTSTCIMIGDAKKRMSNCAIGVRNRRSTEYSMQARQQRLVEQSDDEFILG